MQQEKTITCLEQTCQELKEQLVELPTLSLKSKTQALIVQIQDWNEKLEMVKLQMNKLTSIPPIKMHNSLKEFEELFKNQTFTCGDCSNTCQGT